MTLRLGNDAIDAFYLGSDRVDRVYLGDDRVWPPPVAHDGSVELTAAAGNAPFGDHFGYVAAGTAGLAVATGAVTDPATSKVTLVAGHRNVRFNNDNFHIGWAGIPSSGTVYGRWVPNTGNAYDFTLTISDVEPVYNQWADPSLRGNFPSPFYQASMGNFTPAGVWNAASGLPAGKIFLYSDAARSRLISLDTRRADG